MLSVPLNALQVELDAGVSNDGYIEPPESPIARAAQMGNIFAIEKEIAAGNDINWKNSNGWTPVMYALNNQQFHALNLVKKTVYIGL